VQWLDRPQRDGIQWSRLDTLHKRTSVESQGCVWLGSRGSRRELTVVAAGVAGELQDLGGEVLEHRGEVHGGTRTDAGGVLARLEVARDAAHGELQPGLGGAAHALLGVGLALAASGHCERVLWKVGVWGARGEVSVRCTMDTFRGKKIALCATWLYAFRPFQPLFHWPDSVFSQSECRDRGRLRPGQSEADEKREEGKE